MKWRKTSILASALAIGGAMVAPTAASAADAAPSTVKITFKVQNTGAFTAHFCVSERFDISGFARNDGCFGDIIAGTTTTRTFEVAPGTQTDVEGEAVLGRHKRLDTVYTAGNVDETYCFKFSGTTLIGFKFREIVGDDCN